MKLLGSIEPKYRPQGVDIVNITYIDRDNIEHNIEGKIGDNVLFLAHRHDIDIEGACEAALVKKSFKAFIINKPVFLGMLHMSCLCRIRGTGFCYF